MILRATDSSKTVTTANTWQTAIALSTITDFNRFYIDNNDPYPIRLSDGSNRIKKYRIVPFGRRLDYKNIGNTAVYDAANKILYLNGTVGFAGTLYINYLKNGSDFDEDSNSIWSFPSWSHLLLPLFAVGIHKGGVDKREYWPRSCQSDL
jgi:hypothetical protein